MCRKCIACQREGQRFCSGCGSRLVSSPDDDVTSGLIGATVGAVTDSALAGGVVGGLLGGSLVGGLLGSMLGDGLDGDLGD